MSDVEFHEQNDLNEVPLEGEITVPGLNADDDEFSTLDEPVKDTIMRDVKAVGVKFWHVLYPKQSSSLLREWDLWGPLILCVFMAMMLQGSTEELNKMNDGGPQFAEVFVIYWVGAVVVTLNTKLLGGDIKQSSPRLQQSIWVCIFAKTETIIRAAISFFQSVCVLGYCVCPLTIALIICRCLLILQPQTTILFVIRFITVVLGFGWSTFASTAFLAESQPPHRKTLAMYPICLFYFIISWLIISHTHT